MNVKNFCLAVVGLALVGLTACTSKNDKCCQNGVNPIEVAVPERPAGQQDVIQLTTPKLDTVRVGFVGLGMRGPGAVARWTHIPGTKIVALCDVEPDRVAKANEILVKAGLPKAAEYSGSTEVYKELCDRDDIDIVYIATDWIHHAPIAIYAMEKGKHAAIEVPAATSLQECWDLINTSERTRKHCMMLENCVYDFFELTTLNMAQKGLFGDILHVEGSYIHNLSDFWGDYWNNWRLDFNRKHKGDVYATHGFGPACQLLNIHRGDRLKTLVAMESIPATGPELVKKYSNEDGSDFKNGDHTMTIMRTEKGKTILIEHDVMNPRPYSRMYQLTGTKGFANKYPVEQYCFMPEQVDEKVVPNHENLSAHSAVPVAVKDAMMQEYKHPIHQEIEEIAKQVGGHGGMDYVMDYRLVYCLRNGLPLDMDVYDLAEWSCVGELGAISIENGSAPVAVPDFTRGAWNKVDGYHHQFVK